MKDAKTEKSTQKFWKRLRKKDQKALRDGGHGGSSSSSESATSSTGAGGGGTGAGR